MEGCWGSGAGSRSRVRPLTVAAVVEVCSELGKPISGRETCMSVVNSAPWGGWPMAVPTAAGLRWLVLLVAHSFQSDMLNVTPVGPQSHRRVSARLCLERSGTLQREGHMDIVHQQLLTGICEETPWIEGIPGKNNSTCGEQWRERCDGRGLE